MVQCLLFDCDGTLVDSERLCNVGLVTGFRELGVELDADELVLRFRGWKLATVLQSLEHEYAITLPSGFVDSYRRTVSALFETELRPVQNIESTLEQLDYPKAVVSSGPVQKIRQALRVCGLSHYFQRVYSSYEVGTWKPDPGIYEFAAKDMGFRPGECAAIDDGLVGVEAGHLAGTNTFFYNRYCEECAWPGVVSFSDMASLPKLIRI